MKREVAAQDGIQYIDLLSLAFSLLLLCILEPRKPGPRPIPGIIAIATKARLS